MSYNIIIQNFEGKMGNKTINDSHIGDIGKHSGLYVPEPPFRQAKKMIFHMFIFHQQAPQNAPSLPAYHSILPTLPMALSAF